MDAIECILTRRSIRKYAKKEVSEEIINKLLECAMQAPSAANEQPWEFIVIRDKDALKKAAKISPWTKMVANAGAAIIVCADKKKEHVLIKNYSIQDCCAATQNILLASHALGLGAVWCAIYPDEGREKNAHELFAIPAHVVPLCIISIGYPDESPKIEKRFKKERIHNEKW